VLGQIVRASSNLIIIGSRSRIHQKCVEFASRPLEVTEKKTFGIFETTVGVELENFTKSIKITV
jgi:hypothetical protein